MNPAAMDPLTLWTVRVAARDSVIQSRTKGGGARRRRRDGATAPADAAVVTHGRSRRSSVSGIAVTVTTHRPPPYSHRDASPAEADASD